MKVSDKGAGFIAHFEGIFLYAYPDPGSGGDPWTIGIGATHYDGMGAVYPGDIITMERALSRFRATLDTKYGLGVSKALTFAPLQHEFDALTSFHYNTGAIRSGSVDDKLNRGDVAAAMDTLVRYTKASGRVMRGLARRRAAERRMYEFGDYGDYSIAIRTAPDAPVRYVKASSLKWRSDVPTKLEHNITVPPLPSKKPAEPPTQTLWGLIAEFLRKVKLWLNS